MTDTVNVSVTDTEGWKAVLTGPATGSFSIGKGVQFCQRSTPPPDDFVGHRNNGFIVGYELGAETLYVKVDSGSAIVVMTPGV